VLEPRGAENGREIVAVDPDRARGAFGDLHRGVPQRLADLALETAHTRLARVVLDDLRERSLGDLDLPLLDAVGLELTLHEIAFGDLQLLGRGIAREADDL